MYRKMLKLLREEFGDTMYFKSMSWSEFTHALGRKKVVNFNEESKLARVLTTLDLTALGIGSTLGVGVYVLAGEVSKTLAGPAVIISFLIAAIASVFAGLCYAEFGARVPKAGSAYVYSYVSVGEFVAFIIGWNLILEYVIGSASVVKGLFTYLDKLLDHAMSNFFEETMPIDVDNIASFPDLFSLGVTIVFSLALAFGAKESSLVNNIFTVVNLCVVIFVVVSGMWKVDADNWSIPKEKIFNDTINCTDDPNAFCDFGEGGFAPYGVNGIIKGAATCFYGFIGFDCIATAGEEAKTPQRSIPIAIVVSLFIVFLAYFSISTVLTMMLPYYLQDEKAPFPHVYEFVGWDWAKYIVTAGALCGLFSSLFGAMFPLPRIIYAMASDGLLFKFMGKIHPKFQTPFLGTLFAGLFTGCLACIFDLNQLFAMMSIGTLLAYSMVAACVLILRFDEGSDKKNDDSQAMTFSSTMNQLFSRKLRNPTRHTSTLVSIEVWTYCAVCFCLAGIVSQCEDELVAGDPLVISGLAVLGAVALVILISINCQPRSSVKLSFVVPFVPWLPALSILINLYLMTMLDSATWIRFVVWIVLGLATYFLYGLWKSTEIYEERNHGTEKITGMEMNHGIENRGFDNNENVNNESKKY